MTIRAKSLEQGKDIDLILVNRICEIFRKLSIVRLENEDEPIPLLLSGINPLKLNLSYFDLRQAQLKKATLMGVDLRGANLSGANLGDASFGGTDLRGAIVGVEQLCKAFTIYEANLDSAILEGVNKNCPERNKKMESKYDRGLFEH